VSDSRTHRGPHPEDQVLFHRDAWPRLRDATGDLSWLLSRDYSMVSALKLVGDRYQLRERQRLAVMRCACSDKSKEHRTSRCQFPSPVEPIRTLFLDGYNVLTSVEAALGGGVILHARDGCFRDMASMHGTYRKVVETIPALNLIGESLESASITSCVWYLDSPVSNSGRLKTIMHEVAVERNWNWLVELTQNPDAVLATTKGWIATADSIILDQCDHWMNLARAVISERIPSARVVDLS